MMDDQQIKARQEIKKLPGMKENELTVLGPCRVCGKQQLDGMPLFYKVTIARAGFDLGAVQRRVGLGMMVGSQHLGAVMGPDEDLAKVIDGPHDVFVHEECAGNVRHLLDLVQKCVTKLAGTPRRASAAAAKTGRNAVTEPDLFSFRYPDSPGYKEPTTSRAAARKAGRRAQTLRDQVYAALRNVWPAGLTADEVALRIGRREFSVRPRLSELRAAEEIMPTTLRRPNESGVDATVWVCKNPEGI